MILANRGGGATAVHERGAGGGGGDTHRSNKSSHHCEEEGEDGHQHAGLAEPPEDSGEGGSFPAALLQLVVPQLLQPGNTAVTDCCETGLHLKARNKTDITPAQWPSGRVSTLRLRGCGFESLAGSEQRLYQYVPAASLCFALCVFGLDFWG